MFGNKPQEQTLVIEAVYFFAQLNTKKMNIADCRLFLHKECLTLSRKFRLICSIREKRSLTIHFDVFENEHVDWFLFRRKKIDQ